MPNESGKQPVLHKKHVARLQRERQQSKIILYSFIGIVVAIILLIGYGILDEKYLQLQRPVAKVNETQITLGKFEARVRLQRQQLLGQYNQLVSMYNQYAQFAQATGMDLSQQLQQFSGQAQQIQTMLDQPEEVGKTVLDQMINEQVIRKEADKRGITVSKAEVDEMLAGFFQYYPQGTPTPSATPTQINTPTIPAEAFSVVTMTPTPLPTLDVTATPEFTFTPAAATDAQTTGTPQATATLAPSATPTVTFTPTVVPSITPTSTPEPTATPYTREAFDKNYKDEVTRMGEIKITEADYRSLFEMQILETKLKDAVTVDVPATEPQVWARHILVADEVAAQVIIEKLKQGEDFATLAISLSTDTGSGANGGDLGWFGKGMMVDEFEKAAFALEKPGDYTTTPVKTQFGYHIIQLIAKQERPLTAEQYQAARDKAFRDWLEATKKEYTIETFDIWQARVPSEPNFTTMATQAANQQLTSIAEKKATEKAAKQEATPTP